MTTALQFIPEPQATTFPIAMTLPSLLLVEDEAIHVDLLTNLFSDRFEVRSARDGLTALQMASAKAPDMILLDIMLPDIDGYEVCRRMKREPRTSHIPIIFTTGLEEALDEVKGLELGAVDYIRKPINPAITGARVDNQLRLKQGREESHRLARTDALTGLANRGHFEERLAYEYARHARSGTEFSLVLVDIDYFKLFKYKYGHTQADNCLRQIAQAITAGMVRATDMAARFGGEEFVLLLPETGLAGALVFAEKMRKRINELALPNNYSTVADHITASFGVVGARDPSDRLVRNIIEQANKQLHAAKANGRDRVWAQAI
jgi:diguanylate cyclase (GGDEF)-like protein